MTKFLFLFAVVWLSTVTAEGKVITSFNPHGKKLIALTFDACETKTPSHFDKTILNYLISHKIAATFFVSAKFALTNPKRLNEVADYPFIEIENHSYHHYGHMERLDAAKVREEIDSTESIISKSTGTATKFFRFPAGNYDARTLATVENMGYKVVHWSFASGDPDKHIDAPRMTNWVLKKAKSGTILIFHINGRGYATPKALPVIVESLEKEGYTFVRLDEVL